MLNMTQITDFIKTESDRCVRCGLCLPHCPTYQEKKHEGESPRGRLMLLEGLAAGALDLTQSTQTYLNHCLECGACETVCPLKVKFSEIFNAGKNLFKPLETSGCHPTNDE
jgi:glycolate oxidase iron-sulfur subunit